MDIKIKKIKASKYRTNTYIIVTKNGETFVVDPGLATSEILETLAEIENVKLKYILLTHAHLDHVTGVDVIKSVYPEAVVCLHEEDELLLENLPKQGEMTGETLAPLMSQIRMLTDGESLEFVGGEIEVIHTPGHTSGGACYLFEGNLFSGDTLFYHTVGRVDLPSGDAEEMDKSLSKLMLLDGEVKVFPGHGRESSILEEKRSNPYIRN